MAIKLTDVYTTNANPASLDYPQGSFKNASGPGAGDGTPLDQQWANDMLGFFQALLASASIVPNGVADTARASQYLAALQSYIAGRLSNTLISPESDLKVVRGEVAADGTIRRGSGFTTSHYGIGAGLCSITFDPAFSAIPTIIASSPGDEGAVVATGKGQLVNKAIITTYLSSTGFTGTNYAFNFIAIGPK